MNMKRVISLHGIRTRGHWQKFLAPVLAENEFIPHPLDYGWFSALGLLIPPLMKRKLGWLREEYEKIISRDPQCKPSIIAHSFGSWLVANLLKSDPHIKFDKVILVGSIVDRKFDWGKVISEGRINYLKNERGSKDIFPRIAELFTYKAGASGSKGFEGIRSLLVVDRIFPEYKHSTYFNELHYVNEWIPALKNLIIHIPSKRISFLLDEKNQKSIVDLLNLAAGASSRRLSIDPSRIRANIFIESEADTLRIPPGLQYNMRNKPELGIPITVGQGCTGQAYAFKKRCWAVLDRDWGEAQLPDTPLGLVDKDLRWVVSTPIPMSINGSVEVVGVFNIDCLKEVKTKQDLIQLENPSDDLLGAAQAVGAILSKGMILWDTK
jgi:hypothetical protein